ncbi:MAG: DUF4329 domain-containing protein [Pseudomonadota bacterium]
MTLGISPFRVGLVFLSAAIILSGCQPAPEDVQVPPRDTPQTREEVEAVRAVFNAVQPASIANNREYCGYIVINELGLFDATDARRGRIASCTPRWPGSGVEVLASYHTHAAYDPDYDGEIPSYDDLASDILEAVDGYIATPAGRIWYVNANRKEARLVCGPGCVVSDPAYVPEVDYIIRERYTLDDLAIREN